MSALVDSGETDRGKSEIEALIEKSVTELADAERLASQHRERHYTLKRQLNDAASPTCLLPREVLSEIFLLTCSSSRCFSDGKPYQLAIGSVCTRWREVAWETKLLWKIVGIRFEEKRCAVQTELLEEWVGRSGNLLLGISFGFEGKNSPTKWQPGPDALAPLARCAKRWDEFYGYAIRGLSIALRRANVSDFPMLRLLHLYLMDTFVPTTINNVYAIDAPLLSELYIRQALPERCLGLSRWDTLKILETDVILLDIDASLVGNPAISVTTLAKCTALERLTCTALTYPVDQPLPVVPFKFEDLVALDIQGNVAPIVHLLNMAKLPALRVLTVRWTTGVKDHMPWVDAILAMVRRSACKLTTLTLCMEHNLMSSDVQVVRLLETLSTLGHPIQTFRMFSAQLAFSRFSMSDRMVDLLTMEHEKQKEHLPMLSWFVYQGNISFNLQKCSDMMKSRVKYCPKKYRTENEAKVEDADDFEDFPFENAPIDARPLVFDIDYFNREWYKAQHPYSLHSFYRSMHSFLRNDNHFHLRYVNENDPGNHEFSSDEDSESEEE